MKRQLFYIIFYTICFAYIVNHLSSSNAPVTYSRDITPRQTPPPRNLESPNDPISSAQTLVIYVFGKTHGSAMENLLFFIRTAVRSWHHADYYIILQQVNGLVLDEKTLPKLPSNAHYVQHENKCFDLGTIGWFLSSGTVDRTKYKYFVFVNSSVRGPYIVAYYDNPIWYTIFTRRLTDHIKLAGCTFSCETAPHIQSYLWAMSFDTLDLFLKNNTVFACHKHMNDAINNGEIAASQILLHSGFGIDSLMTKYRGMDFRLNFTEKCANQMNPTQIQNVDGISLDPFEIVFVKVKVGNSRYRHNLLRIRAYEKWIH